MERNAAYSIAFSELVTYITETTVACESSNPPIFQLCDLCLLYRERLEQLGIESPAVHATRLKDQLLVHIPELQTHGEGHNVMLAFEKDAGAILADMKKLFIWHRLPEWYGMTCFSTNHSSTALALMDVLKMLSPHHCFNLYAWSNMEQISNHSSNIWGIEIRPCSVTSPTKQLLCKVHWP